MAVLDGRVISAGGFTRWPKDSVVKYPDLFGGAKNGFTHATFVFDPRHEASGWTRIENIPGPRRQAAAAAVVGGAL